MLLHPNQDAQALISMLETQRDQAMADAANAHVTIGALSARVKELEEAVASAAQFQADVLSGEKKVVELKKPGEGAA